MHGRMVRTSPGAHHAGRYCDHSTCYRHHRLQYFRVWKRQFSIYFPIRRSNGFDFKAPVPKVQKRRFVGLEINAKQVGVGGTSLIMKCYHRFKSIAI